MMRVENEFNATPYWPMYLSELDKRYISLAIEEDVGACDLSAALIPSNKTARFAVAAREELIACGLPVALYVLYELCGKESVEIISVAQDGSPVRAGGAMLEAVAPARSLLTAERVMLNFVRHLSAVATLARMMCAELEGTPAQLLDTRKTIPGMRRMQKYAAAIGGARNHRFALDSGIMLKDNHIALYGSITEAVEAARKSAPMPVKIEVECDTVAQAEECLRSARPDVVMLDNMTTEDMKIAVDIKRRLQSPIRLEASGNMTLSRLRKVAETGVDFISVGCLTHSPPPVDIGLDVL